MRRSSLFFLFRTNTGTWSLHLLIKSEPCPTLQLTSLVRDTHYQKFQALLIENYREIKAIGNFFWLPPSLPFFLFKRCLHFSPTSTPSLGIGIFDKAKNIF